MITEINNSDNNDYQLFWQHNLQKLEEINNRIEKTLLALEKKYIDFNTVYNQLHSEIDVLMAIYSSFNNLLGLEYLLKLKSLLNDYRKRYTHESIRFNVLFFLHSKIKELRDESFSRFPELTHANKASSSEKKPQRIPIELPFKWITFMRNESWFITPFDEISLLKVEDVYDTLREHDGNCNIEVSGKRMNVIDLMSKFRRENPERTNYFVLVKKGEITLCYAAYRIGKRLLSKHNIIANKLIKYRTLPAHSGHIRIFGKNHIYLS
jgi:hypothetical protein